MTKLNINTTDLKKDVLPIFKDAIDHLNKSMELSSQLTIPNDYNFINEVKELQKKLEVVRNDLRDYYNSYNNGALHFDELNDNLLQQINDIKSVNIFKK